MATAEPPPRQVLLRAVTVVPGTDAAPRRGVDVLLAGGLIARIGSGLAPEEAEILDGTGKFLIPGLWETEAHVTRYSSGVWAHMALRWPQEGDPSRVESNLRSYLACGFTTAVDLGGPTEVLAGYRDRQRRGEITGARLLMVGRQLSAPGGLPLIDGRPLSSVVAEVGDPEGARAAIRTMVAEHQIDGVKANYTDNDGTTVERLPVHSRQTLEAIVDEAHRHDLPVLVHIDAADAAVSALEAGVDNVEHMFAPDPGTVQADVERVTELCVQTGAYWPMTIVFFEALSRLGDPQLLDDLRLDGIIDRRIIDELTDHPDGAWRQAPEPMKARLRARAQAAMTYVGAIHRAGVKLTIATDSGNPGVFHGPSAQREMILTQQAGVPAPEVLRAATSRSAQKLRMLDEVGTVEVGKRADLVLLEADPLRDIANVRRIAKVIQGGRVYDPSELAAA